ncbi:MAG: DUF2147 domain-containing protein [Paracoccaceae bacterium]|nr:DUF2147 domain-containing protein [Paracoccaceae bacterium]
MRAPIVIAALLAATTVGADPAHGTWQTAPDDNGNFGHIAVAPCGDRICGVLVRAFDRSGRQVASDRIGQRIVWDMVAEGAGSYARGKVYAPDRDRTYSSRMRLDGDLLTVEGCVLGICRGSLWKRVE